MKRSGYIILDVQRRKIIFQCDRISRMRRIGNGEMKEQPDKEQLILVYCRSGNRSKQAAEKLVKRYTNIVEFRGIND